MIGTAPSKHEGPKQCVHMVICFYKICKSKYVNCSQLRLLSLFTVASISHFPPCWVTLEWWPQHFENLAKGKLNKGLFFE